MSQKDIDHAIRTTFRNPPILANEDRAQYDDLKRLVLSDIKPRGLQETLLTRDIVDAEWEVCRLRWMKMAILHAVLPGVIRTRMLEARGTRSLDRGLMAKVRKHVSAFVNGDPKAQQQLEKLLEGYQLTLDLVIAATFDDRIVSQIHIDRMTTTALERRNAGLCRTRPSASNVATSEALPQDKIIEIGHEGHPTAPIDGGWRSLAHDIAGQNSRQPAQCPTQHRTAQCRRQGARPS